MSTESSPKIRLSFFSYLHESRVIRRKRFTHHWTIVGTGCCHHRLRRPALWLRLILRRVPLNASVNVTRQDLISIKHINLRLLDLLHWRWSAFVYGQVFSEWREWAVQVAGKHLARLLWLNGTWNNLWLCSLKWACWQVCSPRWSDRF